jgi:hypothetical protein
MSFNQTTVTTQFSASQYGGYLTVQCNWLMVRFRNFLLHLLLKNINAAKDSDIFFWPHVKILPFSKIL